MIVYGIDPGPTQTAIVAVRDDEGRTKPRVFLSVLEPNERVRSFLWDVQPLPGQFFALEQVSMGGMIAGAEIFETCYWSGRFAEAILGGQPDDGTTLRRIPRMAVKHAICGATNAKDANIRVALLDRYGPGKAVAVGTKKAPGPLYGLKSHLWAALAVALVCIDKR